MPTKRQKHTREYKIEAVRLSRDGTRSVAETAVALGISADQLYRWRREFDDDGVAAFAGNGVVKAHDEELHRLRRENKRLTEERDFLKKTTAFFAKESR
jgi:transposase-like protein